MIDLLIAIADALLAPNDKIDGATGDEPPTPEATVPFDGAATGGATGGAATDPAGGAVAAGEDGAGEPAGTGTDPPIAGGPEAAGAVAAGAGVCVAIGVVRVTEGMPWQIGHETVTTVKAWGI